MKRILLTLILSAGILAQSFGQYVDQALLFSQQNFGSTARSKAMGNAVGAIGGDFSTLSINPAGLAIYLRPELSTTLNVLGMNNVNSEYQGQKSSARNTSMNFTNLGYVFTNPLQEENTGLISINFGVGFNKLANFNQSISVSKNGSPHSRMDLFADNTNGIMSSSLYDENNPYDNGSIPWESKLAWENYLIDVSNPNLSGVGNQYQSILYSDELVNQNLTVTKEGFLNEYVFSSAFNINHKLYLGATLGMQDLYYNEVSNYSEGGAFGRFDYSNSASTRGMGYNLKIGAIYKPSNSLRLGFALHTPTYFNFKENYSAVMSSNLTGVSADADGGHKAESPLGDYGYKMNTPTRLIGSIAYQFEKKGMISLDYENVSYNKIEYMSGRDGYAFSSENTDIQQTYNSVKNIRIGGEYKPADSIYLRAGYELFGNPFVSRSTDALPNNKFSYHTINAGIGYRIENISIDVSYSLAQKTQYNFIYPSIDPVKYQNNRSELMVTLGIKL